MRKFLLHAVAFALAASPLAAQAHPDFSGKWSLDLSTAPGGPPPTGTSVVMTVKQDQKTINIDLVATSPMGDQKRTTVVNFDGSPSKNSMITPGGNVDITSSFAWDGAAGVTTSKGEVQGQSFVQTEKWTLDPDGKTLRVEATIVAGAMNQTNKLAFIKQ